MSLKLNLNQKLTPNFTFLEFVDTSHKDLQQKNIEYAENNLNKIILLANFCQGLRNFFGSPIIISSAVRCPELNRAVGGTARSQHLKCEAIDFSVKGWTVVDTFNQIKDFFACDYGQLILEQAGGKEWVHIGMGAQRECLIYKDGKYKKL